MLYGEFSRSLSHPRWSDRLSYDNKSAGKVEIQDFKSVTDLFLKGTTDARVWTISKGQQQYRCLIILMDKKLDPWKIKEKACLYGRDTWILYNERKMPRAKNFSQKPINILKKCSFLMIVNNSSWVNFTLFRAWTYY